MPETFDSHAQEVNYRIALSAIETAKAILLGMEERDARFMAPATIAVELEHSLRTWVEQPVALVGEAA